jgi:hypothetical protein
MHLDNQTPFDAQTTLAFDPDGREMVVALCKASFTIPADPDLPCTLSDQQIPLQKADALSDGPALCPVLETDFVPFKPFCDIIVCGPAQVPGGRPVPAMAVDVQLGPWSKAFHVIGPRVWQKRYAGFDMSEPQPFVVQPIGYEQAWGGAEAHPTRDGHFATIETNPAGVGYHPYATDITGKPLPNTQEAGRAVDRVTGAFVPMAFGPIGRVWMPRRQYAGTYDEAWLNHRMPFPPRDLDARFFQSAPPDQQIIYPKGAEPFRLRGFSADGDIAGKLPGVKITFRYVRKSGRITQKVGHLDTVVFLPAERQLTLVWRANLITDRDIFDLQSVLVMAE